MKKVVFLTLVIMLFVNSCTKNSSLTWNTYNSNATNLDSKNKKFKGMIISDNGLEIFLYGEKSDTIGLVNKRAIVYKSQDFGKTWQEIYNSKGIINEAVYSENSLYTIREVFTRQSFEDSKLYLMKSNVSNGTTKTVHQFLNEAYVKKLNFNKDGNGSVFVRNSGLTTDNYLYRTNDDFKSYDSLFIDKPALKVRLTNDKLFFLSYEKNNFHNLIYTIFKDNIIDTFRFNSNIYDFVINEEDDIWILTKNNDLIELYRKNDDKIKKVNIIKESKNLNPKKLYKFKNFVAVLSSTVDSGMLGGFGGTKYNLYLSFDEGKTFKEERLPIDNYVEPIEFYKDEKIIVYSGAGRISVCDLKSTSQN